MNAQKELAALREQISTLEKRIQYLEKAPFGKMSSIKVKELEAEEIKVSDEAKFSSVGVGAVIAELEKKVSQAQLTAKEAFGKATLAQNLAEDSLNRGIKAQSTANNGQSTANNALQIARAALPRSGGEVTGVLKMKSGNQIHFYDDLNSEFSWMGWHGKEYFHISGLSGEGKTRIYLYADDVRVKDDNSMRKI